MPKSKSYINSFDNSYNLLLNIMFSYSLHLIILSFLHSYKIIKILCLLRLNFLVFLFIPITMINNIILPIIFAYFSITNLKSILLSQNLVLFLFSIFKFIPFKFLSILIQYKTI